MVLLNTGCGAWIAIAAITASGILPVPMRWLILSGAAIGLAIALVAAKLARYGRLRWFAIAAALLTMYGSGSVFVHFQRNGLAIAERYGANWAAVLEQVHATEGRWPASLEEASRKAAAPRLDVPRPYLASCAKSVCDKVAGYFVMYEVRGGGQAPALWIARRDIRREWDWSKREWRKATFSH